MNRFPHFFFYVAALFATALGLAANTAIIPTPGKGKWLERHEEFVALAHKEAPDILFIGDSITDYWSHADKTKGGLAVWQRYFADRNALNFGIAGDRTQHVLWRLSHGELEHIRPKVVVLLIGTNNTGWEKDKITPRNTPAETADGITAIVHLLREKLPASRILLLSVFPRGEKSDPQRAEVAEINSRLTSLDDGDHVRLLDLGPSFLEADGTLSRDVMPDLLHPNEHGYEIWANGLKEPLAQLLSRSTVVPHREKIPLVDISAETSRQLVIDRDPRQYLGHPSTILLEDGKTMLIAYPKGHGRGPIVYQRSNDGGLTWSGHLPTPASWATSVEVPTFFRTIDTVGKKRLLMFSGTGAGNRKLTVRMAISENDGETWSELASIGDFGGIVTMASMVRLNDGAYMAFFHDDAKFVNDPQSVLGKHSYILKTVSRDGGVTWSRPEIVTGHPTAFLCEPGAVRSPDGKQIALLLRENSRRFHSFAVFSNDEGKTWSEPRELPLALTGDRHVIRYAPDGRLFAVFRDTAPGSPTNGDWVGWVGRYEDLLAGRPGEYRVRLMHNTKTVDCGYSGLELLPDGVFVATTYGHWTKDEPAYIVSVRLKLSELDAKLRATTHD